jgi:predicted nucleic acid-binding protein
MILLDTDVLIEIFDKHSSQGEIAFKKLMNTGENIAITTLTLHEINFGLLKFGKKSVQDLEKLDAKFQEVYTKLKLLNKLIN